MFIGHWSAAFIAATHPKAPRLGTLFVAAQLIDWAFFGLLLVGVENMRVSPGISAMNPMDLYDMPYTHSLFGACAWGLALALFVRVTMRDWAAAGIGFAVVVSHWLLDFLVHVPDLTLAGSPPKLGLGLWNHPAVEIPLELGLLLGTAWYYAHKRGLAITNPRLMTLIGFMLLVQAVNWLELIPTKADASFPLSAMFVFGLVTALAVWTDRAAVWGSAKPSP